MKFPTDELKPLNEVCAGMSKHLVNVQAGKEIVITRHGKPEGALLSVARVSQRPEPEHVFGDLLTFWQSATPRPRLTGAQIAVVQETEQWLAQPMERT